MILLGDCLERLKELPDNSVDSVVTDPPWALKFMNKKWDYSLPSVDVWREVIRVLKPGSHMLVCCGTRTQHRMVVGVEDAGFEIRDVITHLYGSGFPKSHNIGDGIGTALKPAAEFWTLARKPLSESTVAKNVLRWGVGGLNIDATRVGYGETGPDRPLSQVVTTNAAHWGNSEADAVQKYKAQGRWPANLILDEQAAFMLDEQSGLLKSAGEYKKSKIEPLENESKFGLGNNVRDNSYAGETGGASRFFYVAKASKRERNAGLDEFYYSKLKVDSCEESTELALSILRVTSGLIPNSSIVLSGESIMATFPKECLSTIKTMIQQITELKTWNSLMRLHTSDSMKDAVLKATDGTSHVNSVESSSELMIAIGTLQEKAGSATDAVKHATLEKLLTLNGPDAWQKFNSFHPTVKPLKLMEYLIKLITPPGGTVLDPFAGSGSTGVAAKRLGFKFIGIEMNEEYCEIARKRIEAAS